MAEAITTKAKGAGSFSIPKKAIETLLTNQATAYDICTYLTLARFTDESGMYASAGISAVNRYTGANKTRGGPVDRALERLKQMRAHRTVKVSNGRKGKAHAEVSQREDLGPLIYDRAAWIKETGEQLPDGPVERAQVLHVLPNFDEPPEERIWIGNNLVTGVGGFDQPLKALKNAGDIAARLLLTLYELHDMEMWGGVRPVGDGYGPWVHYKAVSDDVQLSAGARLRRMKRGGGVGPSVVFQRVCPFSEKSSSWWDLHKEAGGPVWQALEALQSAGLVYEVVMALNRNAKKSAFASGEEYSDIPEDAEPLYELDSRSLHGYKPEGEEGIGWAMARTAGELGHSVALEGGKFDGTYAAFAPQGFGCMVAGIYRLRFRVSNSKNAGVKGSWAGIKSRNRDALDLLNRVRQSAGLESLELATSSAPKEPISLNAGTGLPDDCPF